MRLRLCKKSVSIIRGVHWEGFAKVISPVHVVKCIVSLFDRVYFQFLRYSLTTGSIKCRVDDVNFCERCHPQFNLFSSLIHPTDSKAAYESRHGASPRRPVNSNFGYATPAPTPSCSGSMPVGPSYGAQWQATTVSLRGEFERLTLYELLLDQYVNKWFVLPFRNLFTLSAMFINIILWTYWWL